MLLGLIYKNLIIYIEQQLQYRLTITIIAQFNKTNRWLKDSGFYNLRLRQSKNCKEKNIECIFKGCKVKVCFQNINYVQYNQFSIFTFCFLKASITC